MSSLNTFEHKAIFASAGTGKTYQLTNRYIYILHYTLAPEKIIALTFTRASAGEFFTKIIEKLHQASSSEVFASELSSQIKIEADSSRYKILLRCVLENLNQINLQTLDSFLYKIITSFTPELGLPENLKLLSENSRVHYQKEVQDGLIHEIQPNSKNNDPLKQFWYAFKQSNYGDSVRSIEKNLTDYIDQLYSLYIESPKIAKWGNFNEIFGEKMRGYNPDSIDWLELSNNLIKAIPENLSLSERNAFTKTASIIANFPENQNFVTLITRSIEAYDALLSGKAIIKIGRPDRTIEGPLCSALADCITAIFNYYIKRSIDSTQGTHAILDIYNKNYDVHVRQKGKLTFSDLIAVLKPSSDLSNFSIHDPEVRSLIDFRLDAQFDHWLFDEFQDTSRPQWNIISNLVDEAIQDPSKERSVFFVGDTKQSLYLWRNSDDRLFQEICDHYESAIAQPEQMTESYRSSPAIMDAVNAVFDDNTLISNYFSPATAERWKKAWRPHYASKLTQNIPGYAAWIKVGKDEDLDKESAIIKIIQGLDTKLEALSLGILVRSNKEASVLAQFLRQQNINYPIRVGASACPAQDNSAGLALIAMLELCIHPSDSLSKGYLMLIDSATRSSVSSLIETVNSLRAEATSIPMAQLVLKFSEAIIEKLDPKDTRHRSSLRLLIQNSAQFELEENATLQGLIKYLKNYRVNETNPGSVITIETIHKSKGLEYDIVLLINNDKKTKVVDQIQGYRNEKQSIEWILEPFKKEVMQALPDASKLLKQATEQNQYSSLCTLYVAMTRAKKALYMISDLDGLNSGSPLGFLQESLGDGTEAKELFPKELFSILWNTGSKDWYNQLASEVEVEAEALIEVDTDTDTIKATENTHPFKPTHKRLNNLTASKKDTNTKLFLSGKNRFAKSFGEKVHLAFQKIDWYENQGASIKAITKELSPSIQKLIDECFDDTAIQRFFSKPDDDYDLWKEKSFSYCEHQTLISGTFDRVHLFKKANGEYYKAEIIDFKTDLINEKSTLESATQRHLSQMKVYHEALAKLLNIDEGAIQSFLLFTSAKKIVSI